MEQPISEPQPEAAPDDATKKAKRAGKPCITLFVVFAIVAGSLNFGKAAWHWVEDSDGSHLNFEIFSCLGLGMGIYAIIFLARNFRRVLGLSSAKKTLGLIGGFGLVAHVALALFMPLTYGMGGHPPAGTAGHPVFGQKGPEQWNINGRMYDIASTCDLVLPEGLQFTIEYSYQFPAGSKAMDDQQALEVVFPLMRHAYQSGLYKQTTVVKVGQGPMEASRIGVSLVERTSNGTRGYRVALSIDEIKRRIEQEAKLTATSSTAR